MEVDDDIFDFLPAMVKKNMIYHCRVYIGANRFSDFAVTGGTHPVLYEICGKQIQSSLRLNNTILKDVALPTDGTISVSMKVHFSYRKRVKEPFYFLKINNNLLIIGKVDQHLTVFRECQSIAEYRISDEQCMGEPNVEIIYASDANAFTSTSATGPTESFDLNSLSYSNKGIDLRSLSGCCTEFDKITRNLRDRVAKASSELHETNVQTQKEFHEYVTQCQTIDLSSNDNFHISRYGDFWIRNVNHHMLIGIPIINCSTRRNVVERVRVSLNSAQRSQLTYTHKLYSFQTENAAIEPVSIQEICEYGDGASQNGCDASEGLMTAPAAAAKNDNNQCELMFNHEWTHQRQFVLYPDNAAIMMIKMDLIDFQVDPNGCEFDVIAVYDVFSENGQGKELQTHLATIKIDTDILHDERYTVHFDSNRLYQDLLAVIASTDRRFFHLKFEDEVNIFQLHDLLLNRLSFESISTTAHVEDNFRFFLSQNMDLTDSMSHNEEDHRMYYCQQEHGYWSGTLIRIRTVSDDKQSNESNECYEMKIYNRDPMRISNLCKTFENELGRKVSIEKLTCYNRSALELELKYQFREEANALNEFSKHLKYKTDKVQKSYVDFVEAQHKTDSIWAELIDVQIE